MTASIPTWTENARIIVMHIHEFVDFIGNYDGQLSQKFDAEFHQRLLEIDNKIDAVPKERDALYAYCIQQTSEILNLSEMHRHGRTKPFGYPGDYLIIDWTYTERCATDPIGSIWDQFYHRQEAPRAVRLRKDRFGQLLHHIARSEVKRNNSGQIRVLNVASGPGREILDGAAAAGLCPEELQIKCIELDQRAIDYAKQLLGEKWSRAVSFEQANALRFRTDEKYDFIWIAGLCDYFNDRQFVVLLKKLWQYLDIGGRLVLGNFSTSHRTRPWIEWCGSWFLIHRNSEDFERLCRTAEIPNTAFHLEIDELQVICYLYLEK